MGFEYENGLHDRGGAIILQLHSLASVLQHRYAERGDPADADRATETRAHADELAAE